MELKWLAVKRLTRYHTTSKSKARLEEKSGDSLKKNWDGQIRRNKAVVHPIVQ